MYRPLRETCFLRGVGDAYTAEVLWRREAAQRLPDRVGRSGVVGHGRAEVAHADHAIRGVRTVASEPDAWGRDS